MKTLVKSPKKPNAKRPIAGPPIAVKKMPEEQKENQTNNEQPQLKLNAKISTVKRPKKEMDTETENASPKKRKVSVKSVGEEEQNAEVSVEQQNVLKFDLDSINKGIFPIFDKLKGATSKGTQVYLNDMISLFRLEEDLTKVCAQTHFSKKIREINLQFLNCQKKETYMFSKNGVYNVCR